MVDNFKVYYTAALKSINFKVYYRAVLKFVNIFVPILYSTFIAMISNFNNYRTKVAQTTTPPPTTTTTFTLLGPRCFATRGQQNWIFKAKIIGLHGEQIAAAL